jgi:putative N6-adenine-specific DNA methylase
LHGRDRNAGAVAIAQANAARAGVAELVQFEARSLGDRQMPGALVGHPGPLVLVGNPPWGQRVGDIGRLRNLYASFGNLARAIARQRPVEVGLVTPDRMLAGATGLGLEARVWTDQGGTRIGLFTGRLGPG